MTGTTTAAVFTGPGRPLEFRTFALPTPRGGEILVEVVACTICGSDLHTLSGRRSAPAPGILGHEILGRVAEFGPTASRLDAAGRPLELGDRVTWALVASCGHCFSCSHDLPQKCERQVKYGHEPLRPGGELTGGLAGHCLLAEGTAIFQVDEALSDASACPANCAGATVGGAIEAAGSLADRRVLVAGSGMLGVTTIAWARALGASEVVACDLNADRLVLARQFGATRGVTPEGLAETVAEATSGRGVDVVFEMSGSTPLLEAAIPLTRLGGRLILIGSVFPDRPLSIAPEMLVRRCLTIRGIHNYAPRHLEAALAFLATRGAPDFDALVSPWTPLSTISEALARPLPPGTLRLGVRPGL